MDDVVVHEYEQIGKSKKSKVRVDPKAELEEMGEYLKSKIEKLEKELDEMRQGPFGPQSEFMQSLPPEEREMALETLRKERGAPVEELENVDLKEIDSLIEDQDGETDDVAYGPAPQVTLQHPEKHKAYVMNFNAVLKDVVAGPMNEVKKWNLWRSFERCIRCVQGFARSINAQVWDVLWESQRVPPVNPRRVRTLALCMLAESHPLLAPQLILYLESLQSLGYLRDAIKCWQENRASLGPNAEVAGRFWRLGVQLYGEADQPEEAENIAMQCLDYGSFTDASVLVPVITSWARRGTQAALERAWACYLRFKMELGESIKPEDYEIISTTLLNQGHPDMALAVFKDMVLDHAEQDYKGHDSFTAFRRLAGYVGELQSGAVDEREVSRVSLAALIVLPRFLQNKFFYASWIKKLIGLGEVDAASKVVELMYERRIRPDARHVNGIIGAWLREKTDESREKAERMCWAMINARIELVRNRQSRMTTGELVIPPKGLNVPTAVHRPVPPATIETFSILLLHYTRRCKDDLAEQLMEVMTRQAMIKPNAFIYNHWLYASLRGHDLGSVWTQYQNMKADVMPDLETFACLWDTAKVQWDLSKASHARDFPTARKLFGEMSGWMARLGPGPLIRAKQEFSRELHDQIIRSFCLSHDLRGTLCALHGLVQLFDAYPDPTTSRLVVIQLARLLPVDDPVTYRASGRRGSRRPLAKMHNALQSVNDILETVSDRRAVALTDADVDPHNLDRDAASRFRLHALSDLLLVILARLATPNTRLDNEIALAAAEMGIHVNDLDLTVIDDVLGPSAAGSSPLVKAV